MNNLDLNFGLGNTSNSSTSTYNSKLSNRINSNSSSNDILQIYMLSLIGVYFLIKIIYPLFYGVSSEVNPMEELSNLSITLLLALVIFIVTKRDQQGLSNIFFLGLLIGMNLPAIFSKVTDGTQFGQMTKAYTQNFLSTLFYLKLIGILILLTYVGITTNPQQYLTILGSIIFLIIGILYTKRGFAFTTERDEKTGELNGKYRRSSGQIVKFGLSFVTWVLGMLFLYPGNGSVMQGILQFLFGIILGMMVGNMSFQGPDFMLVPISEASCQGDKDCRQKFNLPINVDNSELSDSVKTLWWILFFVIGFNLLVLITFISIKVM